MLKLGFKVFGIAPGAVKTAMTVADFEPGGLADWVASETPIKRWIEPEEVAEISLFLASGKASAMQGQILTIDGGWVFEVGGVGWKSKKHFGVYAVCFENGKLLCIEKRGALINIVMIYPVVVSNLGKD